MDRHTSGRHRIEIVEIDQDQCTLTYGQAPCQAVLGETGPAKCFNTLTTCQDPDNYTRGTLTLRFCGDYAQIPDGCMPLLKGVSTRPGQINPGGADKNSGELGRRATIDVSMGDAPSSGFFDDPYWEERYSGAAQAGGGPIDPTMYSTFWRKWRARNDFYLYRPLRYITGYIDKDGQVQDAIERHYVITGFSGPSSSGDFAIQGKDVLTLAQRDKAEAPRTSHGKLLGDLSETSTSLTLNPIDIGQEYPASGYVAIGDEIMRFSRSGDNMTLTRAQWGTTRSSHREGDTVQLCWHVDGATVPEIMEALLEDYARIPAEYLDKAQWVKEATTDGHLPYRYSTLVAKPEKVYDLLNELMEQAYCYSWFDERTNKVYLRAIRQADYEHVEFLDDREHLLLGSVSVKEKADQVITRVVVNYGMINPLDDLDKPGNFSVADVFVDFDLEGEDQLRSSTTKTIYSRWLTGDAGAQAEQIGQRLLARYRVPTKEVAFSLDAKDRDLWLADFATVVSDQVVNEHGGTSPISGQIMSVREVEPAHRFDYILHSFEFELPPAVDEKTIQIARDTSNVNLRDLYDQLVAAPPTEGDTITFVIRAGVVVGSAALRDPTPVPKVAVEVGGWPAGVELILINQGVIAGFGGEGRRSIGFPFDLPNGGLALLARSPITIQNHGVIGGGGGGGGHGGYSGGVGQASMLGGGGGAGFPAGAAGSTGYNYSSPPTPGGLLVGGVGGRWRSAYGGEGGALGQPGSPGRYFDGLGNIVTAPGGLPGLAIDGDSYITWEELGDIRGARVN